MGSGQQGPAAGGQALIDMLTAKTAKELSLDLKLPGSRMGASMPADLAAYPWWSGPRDFMGTWAVNSSGLRRLNRIRKRYDAMYKIFEEEKELWARSLIRSTQLHSTPQPRNPSSPAPRRVTNIDQQLSDPDKTGAGGQRLTDIEWERWRHLPFGQERQDAPVPGSEGRASAEE